MQRRTTTRYSKRFHGRREEPDRVVELVAASPGRHDRGFWLFMLIGESLGKWDNLGKARPADADILFC